MLALEAQRPLTSPAASCWLGQRREEDRNDLRWGEARGSVSAEEKSIERLGGEKPEQAWSVVGTREIMWSEVG